MKIQVSVALIDLTGQPSSPGAIQYTATARCFGASQIEKMPTAPTRHMSDTVVHSVTTIRRAAHNITGLRSTRISILLSKQYLPLPLST